MHDPSRSLALPATVSPFWRIGIVASVYYKEEAEGFIAGAKEVLTKAGIPEENIDVIEAPGSFEVPLLGSAMLHAGHHNALIGFGIILQGETTHAQLLAENVARAMMDLQVQYRKPFAFEILHVNTLEQARQRCIGPGNKGEEAAAAVLYALAQLDSLQS